MRSRTSAVFALPPPMPDAPAARKPCETFDGIVGTSDSLAAALAEADLVAPIDITVLITGETGTGKSQLAHAIHKRSPRRRRPFVEVNCSAIPENLIESEFFGSLPGAYTGATRRVDGKIASAQGGTLFLDEIAELSSAAQSKLLQFVHSRRYYPLGGSAVQDADVRIIAATNVDLREAVRQRRFREDLLYRLQGLTVRMPSLAERRQDIPLLAQHFCETARRKYDLGDVALSPDALRAIEAAHWPGNVRQLASAVETATVRAAVSGSPRVEVRHMVFEPAATTTELGISSTFHEQTRCFQRDVVARALNAANGRVIEAARTLALTRTHLYNLMNEFGIERDTASRPKLRAIQQPATRV